MARTKGAAARKAFLAAFSECGSIAKAAKAAGIDRHAHYDWLGIVAEYPAQFATAKEHAAEAWEDEAARRAFEGITQVEWYQGKPIGTKRIFSDGLAMFMLRGLKPEKYRQGLEVTGAGGGPIEVRSLADVLRDRRAKRQTEEGKNE